LRRRAIVPCAPEDAFHAPYTPRQSIDRPVRAGGCRFPLRSGSTSSGDHPDRPSLRRPPAQHGLQRTPLARPQPGFVFGGRRVPSLVSIAEPASGAAEAGVGPQQLVNYVIVS